MHVACESHTWFIFYLNTKYHYIYRSYIAIFTKYTIYNTSSPSDPALLTWRTSFFADGDEYPSTLVSGLPTTAPPLALPLSPFHTPQFKLHYLHRRHQQSRLTLSGTDMSFLGYVFQGLLCVTGEIRLSHRNCQIINHCQIVK
jgi:hypothetical protein